MDSGTFLLIRHTNTLTDAGRTLGHFLQTTAIDFLYKSFE